VTRSILTALAVLLASPVAASQCGPDAEAERLLTEKFGEARHSFGLSADGRLIIMWANPSTGTWTVTASTPDGITCFLAEGQMFTVPGDLTGEAM
jgi:hypothetical protein